MEEIKFRDKALDIPVPTLLELNQASEMTPCIKITIPANTSISITHKLRVYFEGNLVEEFNTLNRPIGVIIERLEAHGCAVQVFKEEMIYKNAALLEDFSSSKTLWKHIDHSPYQIDLDFYEQYIKNILPENNNPIITIESATANNKSVTHNLKGGNLYLAEPADCIYTVSINSAIINIQNYKAYGAASIVDDNVVSNRIKSKILEAINSKHK